MRAHKLLLTWDKTRSADLWKRELGMSKMLPTSVIAGGPDAIHRFIGGRRRYNRQRQFAAHLRRMQVTILLRRGLGQAEIARQLEVSRSTISRDARKLYELAREERICPVCGQPARFDLLCDP